MRILANRYLARYGNRFDAYMALQRALMARYLSLGGTTDSWCERLAPRFRERYAPIFESPGCGE